MRSFVAVFITFILLGTTCKRAQDQQTQTAVPQPLPADSKSTVVPPDAPAARIIGTFKRTPCLGQCPSYEWELYSDGTMQYHGKTYAPRSGSHTARLNSDQYAEIINKIRAANLLQYADKYPESGPPIHDLSNTIMTFEIDDTVKMIKLNYGTPPALQAFVIELEQWIEAQNWQSQK